MEFCTCGHALADHPTDSRHCNVIGCDCAFFRFEPPVSNPPASTSICICGHPSGEHMQFGVRLCLHLDEGSSHYCECKSYRARPVSTSVCICDHVDTLHDINGCMHPGCGCLGFADRSHSKAIADPIPVLHDPYKTRDSAQVLRVAFYFEPRDYVTITLLDLKYKGRVLSCIYRGTLAIYEVQYANDAGELKTGEFDADELAKT